MGTEKTTVKSSHRNKPPPVPPRPQHLIPIKAMTQYSSMPDILNGWKRDTNPDLLKLSNANAYSKKSIMDVMCADCVESNMNDSYLPMHAISNEYIAGKTLMSNYRDIKTNVNNYTMLPTREKSTIAEVAKNKKNNTIHSNSGDGSTTSHPNGKTSKKFSCIPSRSNSKKKQKNMLQNSDGANGNCRYGKNMSNGSSSGNNNHAQISQTSWYVQDMVENTKVQMSKCEISINNVAAAADSSTATANYRYGAPSENVSTVAVDCSVLTNNSSNNSINDSVNVSQRIYRKRYQQSQPQASLLQPRQTMMSSPSLSSLPPLPKSLSDASLLWETTNKKLSAYPSLSPARSTSSSSSRGSSIVHPKVPPPAVPRSIPVPSDEQNKFSSVYVNSHSIGNGGDLLPRDERPPPPPPPRKPTSLDMKLSLLRKEMHVLRQMDLSLLSQLWSLNESIHEFRQKQELLSPNSPYVNSSDEEDSGCYHSNISSQGMVTSNHHNTLGSSSSKSSISTSRSTLRDLIKP